MYVHFSCAEVLWLYYSWCTVFHFPFLTHRRARVSYYAPPPDGIESSSEDEVGFQLSSMAVETAQVYTFASCVHIKDIICSGYLICCLERLCEGESPFSY